MAAVADCFILTFRAIAGVSKLPWSSVTCEATGTVDRIERVAQFTQFQVRAHPIVPHGTNQDAQRALVRAE